MTDCNLELRLVPPSPFDFRQENPSGGTNQVGDQDSKEKQIQQLTIFYDGKVSVCDVTEPQARTIIKLASEEMDDKWRRTQQLMSSKEGEICMKRSLQRFLQKRKHRIQATYPYHP